MFRFSVVFPKTILAFFLLVNNVVGQQSHSPKVIKYLLNTPDTLNTISGWIHGLIPDSALPKGLGMDYQYLLKNRDGLFCGINGTGHLYRINEANGHLQFQRIDATHFTGHNFFAANFYYGGHLYSLGGYGFWHQNGMLRKYNDFTRDWQPEVIEEERPLMVGIDGFFWMDVPNGKIYLNPYVYRPEGFRRPTVASNDSLLLSCLDLNSGVWKDLGRMNKQPFLKFQTPWGGVELGVYEARLFDFKNNRIYSAGKGLKDKLTRLTPGLNNNLYFYKDSKLYFANLTTDVFDSIALSVNDFIFNGEQLYKPGYSVLERKGDAPSLWWAIPSGALLVFLGFGLGRRRFSVGTVRPFDGLDKDKKTLLDEDPVMLSHKDPSEVFTALELDLLKFIFSRDAVKEPVRVEEVNKLLGLSEKNESVQKKNRNEMINSINQKWGLIGGGTADLLMRQRSALDKRIYYYSINPEARELLGKFLPA